MHLRTSKMQKLQHIVCFSMSCLVADTPAELCDTTAVLCVIRFPTNKLISTAGLSNNSNTNNYYYQYYWFVVDGVVSDF